MRMLVVPECGVAFGLQVLGALGGVYWRDGDMPPARGGELEPSAPTRTIGAVTPVRREVAYIVVDDPEQLAMAALFGRDRAEIAHCSGIASGRTRLGGEL